MTMSAMKRGCGFPFESRIGFSARLSTNCMFVIPLRVVNTIRLISTYLQVASLRTKSRLAQEDLKIRKEARWLKLGAVVVSLAERYGRCCSVGDIHLCPEQRYRGPRINAKS